MSDFDPVECARLIAEVRESGWVQPPAKPLADHLEATVREVAKLREDLVREVKMTDQRSQKLIDVEVERDDLRAQVAKLTEERDHAIAHGVLSQRVCDLENENAHLRSAAGPAALAAIDAYRAAKEKP